MAGSIGKHRHRMKLTSSGKKGYTFKCVRQWCSKMTSLSKSQFWGDH